MKKIIKILVIILFILILACLASIWISYNWLTVTHFTVRSSKISEPFRIVLVSDLHEHQFGRDNEKLAEKIREQSPDLIIIDGDMINGDSENADTAVELVLSGHLHGGQVIIPGVGGLYNSLDGFFPKFDYGQYKLGDSDMVITRGLGSNPKMLPRFNNPPEIAVVEVRN